MKKVVGLRDTSQIREDNQTLIKSSEKGVKEKNVKKNVKKNKPNLSWLIYIPIMKLQKGIMEREK